MLSRKRDEAIDLHLEDGRVISVEVVRAGGSQVRLGITAPQTIVIRRRELQEKSRAISDQEVAAGKDS